VRFTDRTIAGLSCPPGRKDVLIFDDALRGFAVRVTEAGTKTFLFQFTLAGTRRRLPIGEFGPVTTAAARKQAELYRGQVAQGRDPWAERQSAIAAVSAAAGATTVGDIITAWRDKVLAHRRPAYTRDAVNRLGNYYGDWLTRPAASVTRAEVITRIDKLEAERGLVSARRGLSYARTCFGWAVKRGMLAASPFADIPLPGREIPRERCLDDHELGAVWRATDQLAVVPSAFVKLLILSAQRRTETGGMRWDELSPDLSVWTLPAARTKNGRSHVVHLAEPARAVLRALPRQSGNPCVFPGPGRGPITTYGWIKAELDATITADLGAPIPRWVLHDLRRTVVTSLARLGIAPHVADKVLNHTGGSSLSSIALVYQRHEFLAERASALEAWGTHVLRCAAGEVCGDNVVQLRAG
jgi:integrase